ncbi:sulfite exporter family [Apiospora phragmitis]|uniref:Sulfite exporter family n=1 Tax=Apiospora phragmitis TaxID=2905665 RepID=A0ABR1TTQ4_9PEZI
MPEPAQLHGEKENNESARPVSQISAIPEHADPDSGDEDDRSSFATFADEDRSSLSKRKSGALSSSPLSPTGGESQEDLVAESPDAGEDGSGSVIATVDAMSVDGEKVKEDEDEDDRMTVRGSNLLPSIEISNGSLDAPPTIARKPALRKVDSMKKSLRPESTAETVATDILNPSVMDETVGARTARNSAVESAPGNDKPKDLSAESQDAMTTPKRVSSAAPSTDSTPNSLTKDRLPSSLSRVAKSYRTNEWAKHLALADAPEPDELKADALSDPVQAAVGEEAAAPVDVQGLQQTAVTAALPPAVVLVPNAPSEPDPVSRSNSRVSVNSTMTASQDPTLRPSHSFKRTSFNRAHRISTDGVMRQPIPEEETGGELRASPQSTSPVGSARISPVSSRRVSMEQTGDARPPVPGVVSYSSPQTLLGIREVLLRSRSQVDMVPENSGYPAQPPSDAGSVRQLPVQDADDLPLSQRKQLMRQQSLQYTASPIEAKQNLMQPPVRGASRLSSAPAEAVPFDSHQPQRYSTLPSQAAREVQMQNFRQSVAQDLRAGTPIIPSGTNGSQTLLGSAAQNPLALDAGILNRDGAARQSIEQGRFKLLSQKEQETQRKQLSLWEKEHADRLFEERMRRGDLMDAHRDALRRMQSSVRDSETLRERNRKRDE